MTRAFEIRPSRVIAASGISDSHTESRIAHIIVKT